MSGEFELIRRYFTRPARRAVLGVGDDCALLAPAPGHELALSTDMLVEGRHFLPGTDPERLGHKTLAVNLSDCAAVGATPRYALLAGALPDADAGWLAPFSRGLFALAERFDVELVGGDTTRGPRNLCVTIIGEVPTGTALLRSGAKVGDGVWVSGMLGSAAAGLALVMSTQSAAPDRAAADDNRVAGERGRSAGPDGFAAHLAAGDRAEAIAALERPEPRVALGIALRGVATSAIDVSDGLLGDLDHILERSQVGAAIDVARLPCRPWLAQLLHAGATRDFALRCLLAGGDDYELCFTAPAGRAAEVAAAGRQAGVAVTAIGTIVAGSGLAVRDEAGLLLSIAAFRGYDHFAR